MPTFSAPPVNVKTPDPGPVFEVPEDETPEAELVVELVVFVVPFLRKTPPPTLGGMTVVLSLAAAAW